MARAQALAKQYTSGNPDSSVDAFLGRRRAESGKMTAVLDASALIAMIKGERGSAKVAAGIAGAWVSSVNYAEVVSHFVHAGMPEREIEAMLDPLPLTIVPADKALAQIVGRLRVLTAEAGLSLATASAWRGPARWLPAWTSDQNWKKIADVVGVKVVAIR